MPDAPQDDDYVDPEAQCAICLEDYARGDFVATLGCGHMFHANCLQLWITAASSEPFCPRCRGVMDIRSNNRWTVEQDEDYEPNPEGYTEEDAAADDDGDDADEELPNLVSDLDDGGNTGAAEVQQDDWYQVDDVEEQDPPSTPPANTGVYHMATPEDIPQGSWGSPAIPGEDGSSVYGTPNSQFTAPWWPVVRDTEGPQAIYHSGTRLPDGRHALLVDTGAWDNIAGSEWANEVADTAARYGHHPGHEPMQPPLEIQGVGNGTQRCETRALLPVTLPRANGSYSLDKYGAPVIPDSPVPGLLGLKSMKNRRTIIDTINNRMYFCGEGPVEIRPPPGTEVYTLEQAPSGHLLLPISEYEALKRYKATRNHLEPGPDPISLPVLAEEPSATSTTMPSATTTATRSTPSTMTSSTSASASSSSASAQLPSQLGFPNPTGQSAAGSLGFPSSAGQRG